MPNVTFSSPLLSHPVTIFTADEESSNVLALAEAHRIPLPHVCGRGECGDCMIDVLTLSGKLLGSILTEKEKARLSAAGKMTPEDIRLAEAKDIAPRYRLACQFVPRYEDVLVKFSGRPGDA
ncbi:2Fe-2S iron-sulfur cluster-binding protein [Methylocystis parvus]|uniref:2Fe-2S iron-sulfur cluster binding domain-containing protein n=1 Tax=Methylocystis parvus TaxID=134 RepID=A0A6B8M9Q5_9HYPH|nr:2Fe-2S iron-sulfur cluster-binding protein [Methylocystis parvus]QGM99406.1 2Fe-2S iron-sulfur cluster binding domain-containing protein [Methylocystis parvus]WBK00202.1 2Fe-2S iron-sulfur cluster-binding protein [Methylocystis parvus OBBP]